MDPVPLEKVAALARLGLPPGDRDRFEVDLERILAAFQALTVAPVGDVEPSPQPVSSENVFRDDVPRAGPAPDVLEAAPRREGGFFLVPSILPGDAPPRGPARR